MPALHAEFAPANDTSALVGLHARSTRIGTTVLRAAQVLEKNASSALYWYCDDRIAELGGFTAQELVGQGEGHLVLELVRAIRMGEPDEHQ